MGTQKNRLDVTYFEHTKHMLKLMGKKICTILRSIFFCLSKPVHLPCIVDFRVFGHIHLVHVLTYKVEELHLPCMLLLSEKKISRETLY